jgi:hypothetical protein
MILLECIKTPLRTTKPPQAQFGGNDYLLRATFTQKATFPNKKAFTRYLGKVSDIREDLLISSEPVISHANPHYQSSGRSNGYLHSTVWNVLNPDTRSAITIPIYRDGQLVALLICQSPQRNVFTREDVNKLTGVLEMTATGLSKRYI